MYQYVELLPLVGVMLDGKRIRLGSTREGVEELLGRAEQEHSRSLYYFHSELHIVLDERNCVEFIELSGGPDGTLQAVLDDVKLFQAEPEQVYEWLKQKNNGEVLDNERSYGYAFLELSVGLYRESIPENVPEMIAEAKAEGHPLALDEIDAEIRRTYWACAGVGVKDYYREEALQSCARS